MNPTRADSAFLLFPLSPGGHIRSVDAPQSIILAAMAGCALASFFFALAETALFSLGKRQVRQLATQQPARAARIEQLLAAPQDLLATIVFGNTFANAGLLAGGLWMALSGRWSLWPAVTVLFFVVVVFCEVWPKTLAVRRPDVWALRIAPLLGLAHRVTLPFCRLAQGVNGLILRFGVPASFKPLPAASEADYQELLELAQQQGALAASEKEIILQIIRLDHRTVREVMRPRSQMAAIPDDLSLAEMLAAARQHGFRRLPMYDETPDTIVGVLNTRALLLQPEADLSEVIEFPSFVPQSMNLLQLLRSLQRQQRGMAIVLDEFGGTAGMVTIEDILEEVIGPMRQVAAVGARVERLDARSWRLGGATRLDDFRREYPALGDVPGVETIGGLLVRQLEIVPAPGESAVFRGLKLTAVAADERRVLEVLAEVVP